MQTLTRECELDDIVRRFSRLFGLGHESERRSCSVTGCRAPGTIDLTFAGREAASSLRSSAASLPRVLLHCGCSCDNIRDTAILQQNRLEKRQRPLNSTNLDCVSLDDSRNIIFDHVSLSWSCDEIFGIVRCENVTIQWCLIAEPLSNPALHPYGDHHAFGLNISASKISLHHNLIAHYVMRGPQFEANDVRRTKFSFNPQFEAINNTMFDYSNSGSRYTTGIEDHPEEAVGKTFCFQFLNNLYLSQPGVPEIQGALKHGVIEPLRVHVSGNIGPHRNDDSQDEWNVLFADSKPMRKADGAVVAQVSDQKLFSSEVAVTMQPAREAYELVLNQAGCSHHRDQCDQRIVEDVGSGRLGQVLRSQAEVGGWPNLREH